MKVTVLVTSVGSLVGQNILDALEYGAYNRRDRIHVVGTNSIAGSPNNFRCDSCYLVPNTSTDEFEPIMLDILAKEKPALILSGRDEDTEVMWRLLESNPHIDSVFPYGNLKTILYALDKWQTWAFTQNHQLPFAESYHVQQQSDGNSLKQFVDRVGFPLVAKPVRGFASKGVFFIRTWDDLEAVLKFKGYLLQEYLGSPEALEGYFQQVDSLTPLFAHAPNIVHFSCHTVISPTGEIAPVFVSRNEHDSGKTMGFRKVEHPELEKLTMDYAEALYKEGGAGPLTVQFRQDRHGNWKSQEMNMRTNGNTFPRLMLGQDDLGLIFKYFLPEYDFPLVENQGVKRTGMITKSLFCNFIDDATVSLLEENKVWNRQ